MNTDKKFATGTRILEILKLLQERTLTKKEIISELKKKDGVDCVYTPEAFIKYFNTFDSVGFELTRDGKEYTLENSLVAADISDEEKEIFLKMLNNKKMLLIPKDERKLKETCNKLIKYLNGKITKQDLEKIYKEKEDEQKRQKSSKLEVIRQMVDCPYVLKLEYKKKTGQVENINVELKNIQEKNGEMYGVFYMPTKGRNKKVKIKDIVSLTQLPKKAAESYYTNGVSFELYGRLAKLYKLKASEKVVGFDGEKKIISNSEEDKDLLIRRLLKYGDNCKIIYPKELQNDLLELTEKMLENLV